MAIKVRDLIRKLEEAIGAMCGLQVVIVCSEAPMDGLAHIGPSCDKLVLKDKGQ